MIQGCTDLAVQDAVKSRVRNRGAHESLTVFPAEGVMH